jgi:hypothetical protein
MAGVLDKTQAPRYVAFYTFLVQLDATTMRRSSWIIEPPCVPVLAVFIVDNI